MKFNSFVLISFFALLLFIGCIQPVPPKSNPNSDLNVQPKPSISDQNTEATALIEVEDQEISTNFVKIKRIVSSVNGWLAIHADNQGKPGEVIAFFVVQKGEMNNVTRSIDLNKVTPTLYAMLHEDKGVLGAYEFPEDDQPLKVQGQVVVKSFKVHVPEKVEIPLDENKEVDSNNLVKDVNVEEKPVSKPVKGELKGFVIEADDREFKPNSIEASEGDLVKITFKAPPPQSFGGADIRPNVWKVNNEWVVASSSDLKKEGTWLFAPGPINVNEEKTVEFVMPGIQEIEVTNYWPGLTVPKGRMTIKLVAS